MKRAPRLLSVLFAIMAVGAFSAGAPLAEAEELAASEQRLLETVRFLASDELEGRGVGTKGLDVAADYIAEQFRQAGLKTDTFDGSPFQEFEMVTGAELGKPNRATFVGPDGKEIELTLSEDFTPMGAGGSGEFDLPLVFAGYAITAKDLKYDDFAGVDVKGKAVVVIRKEPQQGNPHSPFDGTQNSRHAPFDRKISNAYQNGAAAVILVEDDYSTRQSIERFKKQIEKAEESLAKLKREAGDEPTEEQTKKLKDARRQLTRAKNRLKTARDPMMGFGTAGLNNSGRDIPVLAVRRSTMDEVVKSVLGKDLATIEKEIDQGPSPQSAALEGWRVKSQATVERTKATVKNVAGYLEGEGPLADETVVVGAHYDHLGMGGAGSFVPDQRVVHNGADDNGSGTAALIEIARLLSERAPLKRRVLFVAFTGEERGLHGSNYYVGHPSFPLEKTVAMLNMDMVGRLDEEKLIIQGVDTAKQFGDVIDGLNEEYGFKITRKKGGVGPSDHTAFYNKGVPVMHFFTGTHKDYHRPTDDWEKVNVPGMRRVGELVAKTALAVATSDERPEYVKVATSQFRGGGGDRAYLGSIPDFSQEGSGYKLQGVTSGGPAEKAGLKAGDTIVQMGEFKIGGLEDIDGALRKYKGGDRVKVTALRDGKKVAVEVTLGEPR